MMNTNRFLAILAVWLCLLLGACAPAAAPQPPAASEAAASAAFPLTVTDDTGQQVTLPAQPQRIISLLPSNTEILFAVGAGEQVVGVTSYCNYPAEAAAREQVGGITNQTISVETIVALEPDLVLASASQDEIRPVLEQAGLPVIVLSPATIADIFDNIELVGAITGHTSEAAALTGQLRQRMEAVTSKVSAIPVEERPTVFYEVWHDPLMTAGPNTFIGQLVDLAGGVSIFADVTEDWPQVSPEIIVARNPEVILGPELHGEALAADTIAAREGWVNVAAVKNKRVYLLDGDAISRSGPRVIDMLEEIARDLYPELF